VKATDPHIEIACPECQRRDHVPRVEHDPPDATLASILCPECSGGDFGTTGYFDASGNEIPPFDPNPERTPS
jgi:hypothetical protein